MRHALSSVIHEKVGLTIVMFSIRCLVHMQPQCPLCRRDFFPWDIRKLHVGSVGSTVAPHAIDARSQRLLDAIAHAGGVGASLEDMQRVIDQCRVYHGCDAQGDSSALVRNDPRGRVAND